MDEHAAQQFNLVRGIVAVSKPRLQSTAEAALCSWTGLSLDSPTVLQNGKEVLYSSLQVSHYLDSFRVGTKISMISTIYIMIVWCYFQVKISWYFWYFQNTNLYYYLITFLIHAYLTQTAQVPMLLNDAKKLPKILSLWVGCNNITDDIHRRTAHATRRT